MVTISEIFSPCLELGQSLSSCQVSEKSIYRFGQNAGTNIDISLYIYIYSLEGLQFLALASQCGIRLWCSGSHPWFVWLWISSLFSSVIFWQCVFLHSVIFSTVWFSPQCDFLQCDFLHSVIFSSVIFSTVTLATLACIFKDWRWAVVGCQVSLKLMNV